MRSRFTTIGKAIATMVIILFLWAYLSRNLMVAMVGAGLLLYLAYRRMEFHGLVKVLDIASERKIVDEVVHKDSPFSMRLTVSGNEVMDIRGSDEVPDNFHFRSGDISIKGRLRPGKPLQSVFSLVPLERGMFRMPPLKLGLTEGRGLFEAEATTDPETEIFVRASKKDIALAHIMSRRKQFEITGPANRRHTRTFRTDFRSVREYMPGDRFRDIDWKAASRLTRLMTKEFETETNLPTMLLVDTSLSMREIVRRRSKLDHAVSLAIQIAIVMDHQNHPVGLISFDETSVRDHIIPGTSDIEQLIMSLFKLPNPIQTGGYPGPPSSSEGAQDTGVPPFLAKVSPFLDKRRGSARSRDTVTGIFEAFREMKAYEETGLLVVLITDLETNPPSMLKAIKMAVSRKHRLVLISPFSWAYHLEKEDVTPEVLERAYADHQVKQSLLRGVRAAGARVIEIGSRERGETVLSGLRRMSR